jgi:CheY-like chemotaxis protein
VPARILLAEDNIVNQRVASGLLIDADAVDIVSNGFAALAAMGSSHPSMREDVL